MTERCSSQWCRSTLLGSPCDECAYSEHLFSSAGDIADDKLTCLLAENLERLVFLKANFMWNCELISDVGLKTDFILSFNVVLVSSLLYIGLLIMDDDEPDRMMMIMLTMI